jgi:hypothetical protein
VGFNQRPPATVAEIRNDLGRGPLGEQARLGDFWILQRGVFTVGRIFFAAS